MSRTPEEWAETIKPDAVVFGAIDMRTKLVEAIAAAQQEARKGALEEAARFVESKVGTLSRPKAWHRIPDHLRALIDKELER